MGGKIPPIVVSYSELDAFRQCPHKHVLAYRQRWITDKLSPALTKGRIWHEVMEIHYGHIMSGASDHARREAVAKYLLDVDDEEIADLLAWMFDGYEEMYGTDPQWEIQGIEAQQLIRLPTTTGRPSRFWLRMRADMVVVEKMGPRPKWWLVDHKSGQRLPTDRELDIDDQFGLYTWGLRKLKFPIFGSIYSAARTQRNVGFQPLEERFARIRLYRTDQEVETIAREAFVTARTAYKYTELEAPRAPDTDRCRWRCQFTEPCLLGRKAGPQAEFEFLTSAYKQITEDEQLAERGYVNPMTPP